MYVLHNYSGGNVMRKIKQMAAVVLAAAMVITVVPADSANAAKALKLSKKKVSVKVGETVKITVKNAKKSTKVKWKTSKSSVASISKKNTKGKKAYAKIKGVSAGKANITATYKSGKKNKKLVCKVTVTAAGNTAPAASAQATQAAQGQNVMPPVTSTDIPAPATATPSPTRRPTATPKPTPTASPVPSPDAGIYKINTDITIDGTIDAAWEFADAMPISNWTADEANDGEPPKVAQTQNGAAKMLWTDKYFYILVTADDPELDFGNEASYNRDSIEIFFDEHNNKKDYGTYNEFQYRLVCNPSPTPSSEGATPEPIGALTDKQYWDGGEIKSAVAKTETGYACEFAIPLNDVPVVNNFVGVEVQINDASGGYRNGTWNLFANPAGGDAIPYDSTAVFGDCQYIIKKEAKVITLDLDSEHCNMQKPDQFKNDSAYDAMNSLSKIDDENKWVYCNTANNLTVYFPEGRTVVNGEKAEVKITGTYTPGEEEDSSVVFRLWLADTYNRVLKGDSPITQSNQIINDVTKEWLAGQVDENGDFVVDFTLTADGGEKASEVVDENGETVTYDPRGIADALMIKAPSYNSMIGNVVIKSVVITVYDPVEFVDPGKQEEVPGE